MLRKIIHTSIVVLLLISTMGVTMYRHYCSGYLMSKSIGFPAKKCCNDGCKACHNESQTFKITDNFEANSSSHKFKAEVKKILDNLSLAFIFINIPSNSYPDNNLFTLIKICDSPPLITENQTAVLQVFRL
jgi:hypothetical protein